MKSSNDQISRSLDRYLCAILMLKKRYFCVRSVDVSHYMNCSKPAVSTSVRKLEEAGLVVMEPDGNLLLTPAGENRAQELLERFAFFRNYLTEIGVDALTAEQEALAVSHVISDATVALLQKQLFLSNPDKI